MGINFKLLFQQTGKLILFYIMEWRAFYWRISAGKTITVKVLPDTTIKLLKKGDIAEIAYKTEVMVRHKKSFEYSTLELFKQKIQPGDVILDIGANAGMYSIFFSQLTGAAGKVFAFEPDKETGKLLKGNLELNNCSNVQLYNVALSDTAGYVQMQSHTPDTLKLKDGDAFKFIQQPTAGAQTHDLVQALRLDDIKEINEQPRIDYIKLDVEGAELLVLKGAMETIRKYKPVIILELTGKWAKRFNYKPYQVLLLLSSLGYEMEEYDLEQWLATALK